MIVTEVRFDKVDVVFGNRPELTFSYLEESAWRDAILEETGQIVGIAGADFSVRQSEICVLAGPKGAGKSTLLRTVNGLNRATRGRVLVNDDDVPIDIGQCDPVKLRQIRRRRVSMVFEDAALLPWRTVRDNVGLGLELRGMARNQRALVVDHILEAMALEDWAEERQSNLPDAVLPMVGLARAFATDASVILLDEPFHGLDDATRMMLQDKLIDLQRRYRKTIILATSDLNEAMKLADQIVIIEQGRVPQQGAPEEIIMQPVSDYLARFVAHMNPLMILPGFACMTPLPALSKGNGGINLDPKGLVRLSVNDASKPVGAMIRGRDMPIVPWNETKAVDQITQGQLVAAPAHITLRTALELRHRSGMPILLIHDGKIIGVLGDNEIYRSLLRQSAVA